MDMVIVNEVRKFGLVLDLLENVWWVVGELLEGVVVTEESDDDELWEPMAARVARVGVPKWGTLVTLFMLALLAKKWECLLRRSVSALLNFISWYRRSSASSAVEVWR